MFESCCTISASQWMGTSSELSHVCACSMPQTARVHFIQSCCTVCGKDEDFQRVVACVCLHATNNHSECLSHAARLVPPSSWAPPESCRMFVPAACHRQHECISFSHAVRFVAKMRISSELSHVCACMQQTITVNV